MAAISTKRILAALLFALPLSCSGQQTPSDLDRVAFEISKKEFQQARQAFESATQRCEEGKKALPASLVRSWGLNLNEIKAALLVLNRRAEHRCLDGTMERFYYAAKMHADVAEHYGLDAGYASEYPFPAQLYLNRKRLEAEARYARIDKAVREYLESLEVLRSPFLVVETVDELRGQGTIQ